LDGTEIAAPAKGASNATPAATLQPDAQARLLAMLSQVVMQLEHYVRSKDLSAIHNEDVILGAAVSELLAQTDTVASNQGSDFKRTHVKDSFYDDEA
jgi:hypothetical protein